METSANIRTTGITRRVLLQRAALLAGIPLGAQALAACGASKPKSAQKISGDTISGAVSKADIATLGWGIHRSVTTLDMAKDFSDACLTAATLSLEPLVVINQELKLQPWLATFSQPDPTTLVYDLRPGVTFTDGSPLTPDDVVFSWQRHLDKKLASQLSSFLASFGSISATGPHQVTIKLKNPDPTFPYNALFVHIHNKKFAMAAGSKLGSPGTGVLGTGMYTISDYRPDAGLLGVRNEKYWGTKPRAKQVQIQIISSYDTMALAVSSGKVGGAFDLPLANAAQFRSTRNVKVGETVSANVTFWSFPVTVAPFDDVHVRRALAHCVDRAGLVRALLGGGGEPARSLSTPPHWTALLGSTAAAKNVLDKLPDYAFDLDAAKAELKKSKHAGGFTISTKVPSDDNEMQGIALSLAQNLKQIGVTLNVSQISPDEYNNDVFNLKKPELWVVHLNTVYPDPMDYFGIVLPSSAIPAGGYNFAGYRNPTIDQLVTRQASASAQQRSALLQQIATVAQTDLPYAPIYWPNATTALNSSYRYNNFNTYSPSLPWAHNVGSAG